MYNADDFKSLKTRGEEIRRKGYSFERLHHSALLFWKMVFNEILDFESGNITLVDKDTLHRIYDEERRQSEHDELRQIYPSLPQQWRERYSLESALALCKQQSGETPPGKIIRGLFLPHQDQVYVLDTADMERKTAVIMHELAHRQAYRSKEPSFLADHGAEEEFCRAVEHLYWGLMFNQDNFWSRYERNGLRERYQSLPLADAQYTAERLEFYTQLLSRS